MISNFHAIVFEHHQFLFQLNQLFYTIIVIVRGLRRRRTDIGRRRIDSRRKRNDRNSLKDCVFRGDLEATFTLRQWRTKFQSGMG